MRTLLGQGTLLSGAALLAGALSGALGASPAEAQAGTNCGNLPCAPDFNIAVPAISKSPTTFKFQAQISKAKIPLGDAVFSTLFIDITNGVQAVCSEQLSGVRVRDGVLNVEIGRGMTCQLDDVIASNPQLYVRLCIENQENCLTPIKLSTVPYAVKASYANVAERAEASDVAAQCHYAHRVTADMDLLVSGSTGSGYFDHHTPLAPEAVSALPGQSIEGGYIQWTPVATGSANILNLCSQDENGTYQYNGQTRQGVLSMLDALNLYATTTVAHGALEVSGDVTAAQDVNVGGNLVVTQNATVFGAVALEGDVSSGGIAMRWGDNAIVPSTEDDPTPEFLPDLQWTPNPDPTNSSASGIIDINAQVNFKRVVDLGEGVKVSPQVTRILVTPSNPVRSATATFCALATMQLPDTLGPASLCQAFPAGGPTGWGADRSWELRSNGGVICHYLCF